MSAVQIENGTALAACDASTGTQEIDALYIASEAQAETDGALGESYWSGVLPRMSIVRVGGDHMDV